MRKLIQWLLLLAVLGTAGWFLSRWALGSARGREVTERRLGRFLDMDVEVAAVRLEWPFVVVIEGLEGRFPNGSSRNADLHVQEIRLRPFGIRHASIRRPSVRLVKSTDWEWQPVMLRGLVLRNGAADPVEEVFDRVSRSIGTRWSFDISSATVLSRDADGEDVPVFGGLSWRLLSIQMEGHGRVLHHRISFQSRGGVPVGGDGLRVVEWLSTRGQPPLTLWPAREGEVARGATNASTEVRQSPKGTAEAADDSVEEAQSPASPEPEEDATRQQELPASPGPGGTA